MTASSGSLRVGHRVCRPRREASQLVPARALCQGGDPDVDARPAWRASPGRHRVTASTSSEKAMECLSAILSAMLRKVLE